MAISGIGQPSGPTNSQAVMNPDPLNPVVTDPKDPASADNFMRLMIEQLKAQDPLSPMQSNEFTQQIATLNSLQQLVSMNQNITQANRGAGLSQASSLIGKYVEGLDAESRPIAGVVEKVDMVEGLPVLKVGDQVLLMDQVASVQNADAVSI